MKRDILGSLIAWAKARSLPIKDIAHLVTKGVDKSTWDACNAGEHIAWRTELSQAGRELAQVIEARRAAMQAACHTSMRLAVHARCLAC